MYGNARYYYHNMSNTNEVVFSDSYAKIVGDLGRSVSADVSISKIIIQTKFVKSEYIILYFDE